MIDFGDLFALIGVSICGWGLWWIYPPLTLLLVGGYLIAVGARYGSDE